MKYIINDCYPTIVRSFIIVIVWHWWALDRVDRLHTNTTIDGNNENVGYRSSEHWFRPKYIERIYHVLGKWLLPKMDASTATTWRRLSGRVGASCFVNIFVLETESIIAEPLAFVCFYWFFGCVSVHLLISTEVWLCKFAHVSVIVSSRKLFAINCL